jgi:uncharacterized membrane protein YphA (DoxX/SURF4 family)
MNDSMAQPRPGLASLELPGWKAALSWAGAAVLAVLFLTSGLWKITDVHAWAVRLAQARVPQSLSLAGAMVFGIAETVAGVLILVPRLRRWGAILTGVLLVVFLIYFVANYGALRGLDCSCFPWIKRVVGPGFFISDGVMLVLAIFAGVWSKPPESLRAAILILSAVVVFALVSFGVEAARRSGTKAPDTIQVNGQPYSLQHGKVFLFFFDPECMHCFDAAKRMSQMHWGDTRVVGIPITQPQFAPQFMKDTGFAMGISGDLQKLKAVFPYAGVPLGVAIENGREKAPLTNFDGEEPAPALKRLGFIY